MVNLWIVFIVFTNCCLLLQCSITTRQQTIVNMPITSYELAAPNYNSTRSLLHVSHSLPGRSSISITRLSTLPSSSKSLPWWIQIRGSSSQISLPSREESNRGVFSSHERQLAHQSEPLSLISSGSFPSPSTSGTLPPHQSSEAIHELSSPTPHQPSVALTTNNHLETEEEIPGPFAPRFQVALFWRFFMILWQYFFVTSGFSRHCYASRWEADDQE